MTFHFNFYDIEFLLNKSKVLELGEYIKGKEDAIIHGKGNQLAKAIKFFSQFSDGFHIGIDFAEKILPRLKNKNGAMYKACIEISSDFRDLSTLTNSLAFFGMGKDENMAIPDHASHRAPRIRSAICLQLQTVG